jgi:hypothetical protein
MRSRAVKRRDGPFTALVVRASVTHNLLWCSQQVSTRGALTRDRSRGRERLTATPLSYFGSTTMRRCMAIVLRMFSEFCTTMTHSPREAYRSFRAKRTFTPSNETTCSNVAPRRRTRGPFLPPFPISSAMLEGRSDRQWRTASAPPVLVEVAVVAHTHVDGLRLRGYPKWTHR